MALSSNASSKQEHIPLAPEGPEYYTVVQMPMQLGAQMKWRHTTLALAFFCCMMMVVGGAMCITAMRGTRTMNPAHLVHMAAHDATPGNVMMLPDAMQNQLAARTNLYLTIEDVVDEGRALLVQHARNVRRASRFLRNTARDSFSAVKAAGNQAWGAVRNLGHAISKTVPDSVKTPLVLIPAAIGLERYASSKGYTEKAIDVINEAAERTSDVLQDVADFAVDKTKAAMDYVADHPGVTTAAVAAVAFPAVLEAAGVIDKEEVERAAHAVKSKAAQAKDRASHAYHDATKKA